MELLMHLAQQTANGVILGSVYALLALGYSMVYGILRLLNFAHGDVFMVCSFVGWAVLGALTGSSPALSPWLVLAVAVLVAMGAGSLLGMAIERIAYRPLRGAARLAPLISAVGVSIFLQNLAMLLTGGRAKVYPVDKFVALNARVNLGAVCLPATGLIILGVSGALVAALTYVVRNTSFGRAMRASAEDIEAAGFVGVAVDRVIALTFALGSALAGAGGVLIGLYFTQVDFSVGFAAGMKAFTAAVLGGIGDFRGAVLGALVLGLTESLAVALLAPVYKDAVAFLTLIMVLLLKPNGILGQGTADRV
ncbi:MAG: branched-chain amino acid ABC transporter permease [Bacillota bacterium]